MTDRRLRIVRRSTTTLPTDIFVFHADPGGKLRSPIGTANSRSNFGRSDAPTSGSFSRTPKIPKSPKGKVCLQVTIPTLATENSTESAYRSRPINSLLPPRSTGPRNLAGDVQAVGIALCTGKNEPNDLRPGLREGSVRRARRSQPSFVPGSPYSPGKTNPTTRSFPRETVGSRNP